MVSLPSMAVMKRQVYGALFQDLAGAIDTANEEMVHSLVCQDFKEGVQSFLEKREPKFEGR